MRRDQCLDWARSAHRLGRAQAARLAPVLDAVERGTPKGLATRHFQACLNSRDMFGLVKLVHVAEGGGDEEARGRRRALGEALERMGFDAAPFERACDAIGPGWLPVFGFEYRPDSDSFPEASLYCERRAAASAAAAAAVLAPEAEAETRALGPRVFALGFDLLAGGAVRLKLYLSAAPSEAEPVLSELDRRLRPDLALKLLRTPPGGGPFAREAKVYVPLPARSPGRVTACSGEEFPELARGRLKEFARSAAGALRGQHLFYIGASAEKVEVYFGRGGSA